MSDFKIKISDIFRYILLGCIEAVLCSIIILSASENQSPDNVSVANQFNILMNKIDSLSFDPTILTLVLTFSLFYVLGYLTQLIIQLFFRGNYLGTGIGEVACFIKDFPEWHSNKDKYPFPDWVYYSNAPDRAVEVYMDVLDTESDADAKQEFWIGNQLFQGLSFILLLFTVFSLKLPFLGKIIISLALVLIFSIIGKYSL